MIEAQVARGHDVTLAVARDDGATVACPLKIGLQAHGLQALADLETDIIHIHNALDPKVMAWAASRGAVATVQDHRSFCPGRGKLTVLSEVCTEPMSPALCESCFDDRDYGQRIYDTTASRLAALKQMRAVTVLSPYMQRELALLGIESTVIPPLLHGLSPNAPPALPPCVLFAGRLVAAKGVRDAVAAWQRSTTALPLVFAGSGTLRAELEAAGCRVLGWQPHHQMSAIYNSARALIMCSRWQEPYGIVGPEALAHAVPVVAWQSGGIASWHPGTLTPWGDIDALAAALDSALATRFIRPAHVLGQDHAALMDALDAVYIRAR